MMHLAGHHSPVDLGHIGIDFRAVSAARTRARLMRSLPPWVIFWPGFFPHLYSSGSTCFMPKSRRQVHIASATKPTPALLPQLRPPDGSNHRLVSWSATAQLGI